MSIAKELVFRTENGKYGMKIFRNSVRRILNHCKKASPNEIGGILVGYYSDDLRWAIVTAITGPPVDSIPGRISFYRGIKGLQKFLDSKWKKRQHYYLGEWHFHPYSSPIPSRSDNMQMINFANNRLLHCPEPILLIIGGDPIGEWELTAHVFVRNTKRGLNVREGRGIPSGQHCGRIQKLPR
jgi:integrative and conjugative element protein (TIGR02256 family)